MELKKLSSDISKSETNIIMKRITILAIAFFLTRLVTEAQTLHVANNNPGASGGVNVFTGSTALADAHAAASANDIIYVVPSPTTYGDLNITKAITIFGVGIRPSKDLGAKSIISQVHIDASDVRLSGLVNSSSGSSVEIRLGWNIGFANIDGIIIENCNVRRILMTGTPAATVSNLLIRNNIITGTGSLASHVLLNTTSNAIITNNVFVDGNIGSVDMVKATNATFTYNIFSDTQNEIPFEEVVDCIFDHNIFYGVRVDIGANSTGNNWTDNLSFGNTIDSYHVFNITTNGNTGSGNIESVGGSNDPLFVNFPLTFSWDDSYDIGLSAGSPALNINGQDIGPSGGATPFDAEGNILPLIQTVTIPAVIPVGTDLPVTIKAKGN